MVLVADSALQMSAEEIRELGIQVMNFPIYLNGEPFDATWEMSRADKDKMRELISDKKNKFNTSGLTEEEVRRIYDPNKGEKIISLHQSFNNTRATGEMLNKIVKELTDYDIDLFDSENMAAGYSVQVMAAAKAMKAGMPYEELKEYIKKNIKNTYHYGILFDLFYLQRCGRLGMIKAIMGSAMKIIPIISSTEESGVLKSVGKVKTSAQGNARFVKMMADEMAAKNSKKVSVLVAYFGDHLKEVEHLKNLIESQGWETDIEIHYTNYANAPHEGPDFYDMGYIIHED